MGCPSGALGRVAGVVERSKGSRPTSMPVIDSEKGILAAFEL